MAVKMKKTIPYNFGVKHLEYIRACSDNVYNIAEGAVRAGKTVDNVIAFCHELRTTPDKLHLATASTAPTAKLILGDCNGFGIEHYFRGQCKWGKYKGNETLIIKGPFTGYRERIVMFVGGAKADSYKKFRGTSIGMWIATEIDLHHEETIKEALTRQAAAGRRKIFWDLNPGSPFAPIYTKYLDVYKAKSECGELMGGYNYRLFTIFDNINISDEARNAFVSQYDPASVEYRRKILGQRCVAEGLVYKLFADDPERFIIDSIDDYDIAFATAGVDFGGGKSAHAFNCTGFTRGFKEVITVHDRQIYEALSPEELYKEFGVFLKECRDILGAAPLMDVYCDSAEQTLIGGMRTEARRCKWCVDIHNARKKEINDRIRFYTLLMGSGRYMIMRSCKATINAFRGAMWDSQYITKDVRLDDGSTNIDNLDAQEYSTEPYMSDIMERAVGL